jgi:hypothetical protein
LRTAGGMFRSLKLCVLGRTRRSTNPTVPRCRNAATRNRPTPGSE